MPAAVDRRDAELPRELSTGERAIGHTQEDVVDGLGHPFRFAAFAMHAAASGVVQLVSPWKTWTLPIRAAAGRVTFAGSAIWSARMRASALPVFHSSIASAWSVLIFFLSFTICD